MALSLYLAVDLPLGELRRYLPLEDADPPLPGVFRLKASDLSEDFPEFEFCVERFAVRPRAAVNFSIDTNQDGEHGLLGYESGFTVVARLLRETSADLVLKDGNDPILLYRAGGLLVLNAAVSYWLTPQARGLARAFAVMPITP